MISLSDRDWFQSSIGAISLHFSEYSFSNIFLFRAVHGYSRHEAPLPHVRGRTYDGTTGIIPLFDPASATHGQLLALLGEDVCLFPATDEQAEALAPRFRVAYNEADSDYIFAAERLATLHGLKERRRQADRFAALAAPLCRAFGDEDSAAARLLVEAWLGDVGRDRDATDADICLEAIALRRELGLFGLIVRTEKGEPAGFLLASVVSPDTAIIHCAKGRRCHVGVFPYMFRAFAQEWPQYRWINFEQDLGNPGFRRAKRAYRPAHMLRKNRLFLKA